MHHRPLNRIARITFRAIADEDWLTWRELRLQALQEAPHAFGASLQEWQGKGDTEERWRKRLRAAPFNLIAYLGEIPAGMVSATSLEPDGTSELISMFVAPFARGGGVGDGLINAVVSWARDQSASRVILCVASTNQRAIALYERNQFMRCETAGSCDDGELQMERSLEA